MIEMEIEEIKKLVGNKKFVIRKCTFCDYPCGYLFRDGKLYYDAGCSCVTYCPKIEPREIEDILRYVNQNNIDADTITLRLM